MPPPKQVPEASSRLAIVQQEAVKSLGRLFEAKAISRQWAFVPEQPFEGKHLLRLDEPSCSSCRDLAISGDPTATRPTPTPG
jgi:hypothetical protein